MRRYAKNFLRSSIKEKVMMIRTIHLFCRVFAPQRLSVHSNTSQLVMLFASMGIVQRYVCIPLIHTPDNGKSSFISLTLREMNALSNTHTVQRRMQKKKWRKRFYSLSKGLEKKWIESESDWLRLWTRAFLFLRAFRSLLMMRAFCKCC